MQPKGSPPNSSNENMANFPTGVGLQFAQETQRNPSQIPKKEERTPPFQTGLSKPRNGLPPLDTTIHPPFLIGEPGSLHIPERDRWKTDLGGHFPTKTNGPARVRASERLVGGGRTIEPRPFKIAAMHLSLPYPLLLSRRSARFSMDKRSARGSYSGTPLLRFCRPTL